MMGILYGILAEIRDVQKGESYKAASKLRKPLQRAVSSILGDNESWVSMCMPGPRSAIRSLGGIHHHECHSIQHDSLASQPSG
jgi:hypothetical protein